MVGTSQAHRDDVTEYEFAGTARGSFKEPVTRTEIGDARTKVIERFADSDAETRQDVLTKWGQPSGYRILGYSIVLGWDIRQPRCSNWQS